MSELSKLIDDMEAWQDKTGKDMAVWHDAANRSVIAWLQSLLGPQYVDPSLTPSSPPLPDVQPGQVWVSCDPRDNGRQLKVQEVVLDVPQGVEPYAVVRTLAGRRQVKLRRFKPTRSGYRLQAPPAARTRKETDQ